VITIKQTVCPEIKPSRCPSYKLRDKDCIGQVYDDRPPLPCGVSRSSGGEGVTNTIHDLGLTPGVAHIEYFMYGIPDLLEVFIDDVLIATTVEPVSGFGGLNFYYSVGVCRIRVTGEGETLWSYRVDCPT